MPSVGPGSLNGLTRKEKRLMLARTVIECDGVLSHVAHQLGYHLSHIYRLMHSLKVWPVVNQIRKEREQHGLQDDSTNRASIYRPRKVSEDD